MPEVALSPLSPTVTDTVRSAGNVSPSVAAVTVTVVGPTAPALSDTLDGLAVSVISELSSSVIVTSVPFTVSPLDVPSTLIFSSPSMIRSPVGVSVNVPVPLLAPAAMTTSRPGIRLPHATV